MTAVTVIVAIVAIALVMALIMTGGWIAQQRTGNSGWVDVTWTFGLGLAGLAAALLPLNEPWPSPRQLIVAVLIAIWSLRLGSHISVRNATIEDDPRYADLIKQWGGDARRQMFWLCQKQAAVTIPLVLSVLLAAQNPLPGQRIQDFLGIAVLACAIAGEGLADYQLRRFASDPGHKGKVCDVGLWRWSRHPNYFFEWFGWLAYPLLAIDLTGQYAWGWLALGGPLSMYWLLVYVSGIPPLEKHMLESRGDAFRDYQARTSAFFPAPPR